MASRDKRGRYANSQKSGKRVFDLHIRIDHNYTGVADYCDGHQCVKKCRNYCHADIPKVASGDSWRHGRRIVELGFLLNYLRYCSKCRLGPIPLTEFNLVGEYRKGLGGYLYVRCENKDCLFVNRVPYGKTDRQSMKKTGMPCFVANTKLGIAMIDSVGGSGKVKNLLPTLNVKPIPKANLQKMERRAGQLVESVAKSSTRKAAEQAFKLEMSLIVSQRRCFW